MYLFCTPFYTFQYRTQTLCCPRGQESGRSHTEVVFCTEYSSTAAVSTQVVQYYVRYCGPPLVLLGSVCCTVMNTYTCYTLLEAAAALLLYPRKVARVGGAFAPEQQWQQKQTSKLCKYQGIQQPLPTNSYQPAHSSVLRVSSLLQPSTAVYKYNIYMIMLKFWDSFTSIPTSTAVCTSIYVCTAVQVSHVYEGTELFIYRYCCVVCVCDIVYFRYTRRNDYATVGANCCEYIFICLRTKTTAWLAVPAVENQYAVPLLYSSNTTTGQRYSSTYTRNTSETANRRIAV